MLTSVTPTVWSTVAFGLGRGSASWAKAGTERASAIAAAIACCLIVESPRIGCVTSVVKARLFDTTGVPIGKAYRSIRYRNATAIQGGGACHDAATGAAPPRVALHATIYIPEQGECMASVAGFPDSDCSIGESPSGKAAAFGAAIRRFESSLPSQRRRVPTASRAAIWRSPFPRARRDVTTRPNGGVR